jgi:hypothetical protein
MAMSGTLTLIITLAVYLLAALMQTIGTPLVSAAIEHKEKIPSFSSRHITMLF